jgi:hypothetical protein
VFFGSTREDRRCRVMLVRRCDEDNGFYTFWQSLNQFLRLIVLLSLPHPVTSQNAKENTSRWWSHYAIRFMALCMRHMSIGFLQKWFRLQNSTKRREYSHERNKTATIELRNV